MRFNNYSNNSRLSFGPGSLPPFIKIMLISNLIVFVLQSFNPSLTKYFGLTPAIFFTEFPNFLFQPFTYMFLHGGFGHIFFNLFALWMFGTEIERTWGSKVFGRFYIFSGLAGAFLTLMVYSTQAIPTIGASAAIYGVLIAYWMMFPNRKLYIYFVVPVKVKWAIPGMMIIGYFFSGGNVAHMAHLGGVIYAFIYLKSDLKFKFIGAKIKNLRYKRKQVKLEKNRQNAEQLMKRVDAILDKINDVGFENLTKEEKNILDDASSELSKRD